MRSLFPLLGLAALAAVVLLAAPKPTLSAPTAEPEEDADSLCPRLCRAGAHPITRLYRAQFSLN